MARVLVIGGNLFLGRSLVERLLTRGDDVVIMHRGRGTPFGDRVREIHCDRNDIKRVRSILSNEQFDVIFDNVYDWRHGTSGEHVLAAAEASSGKLQRYVFTSSVSVYPHGGPYNEDAQLLRAEDPNVYGAQKAESERALFALHERQGTPVATLRPAFIYGPNNPFDRESFFWDRVIAGRPIILPEDGLRTLQFVHVDDVAEAALRAASREEANGHAFNLAGYPPITQRAFVELLAGAAGRVADFVVVPRAKIEAAGGEVVGDRLYFGEYLDVPAITVLPDRARAQLGIELRPLEDGMRETFTWYQSQPRRARDYSWEDQFLATV